MNQPTNECDRCKWSTGHNCKLTVPCHFEEQDTPPSALAVQVGGDHYKKMKIQPMEYSMANKLDACQHTAIKYVTRFRDKGGVADLRKAIHTIEMLIEFEEQANG